RLCSLFQARGVWICFGSQTEGSFTRTPSVSYRGKVGSLLQSFCGAEGLWGNGFMLCLAPGVSGFIQTSFNSRDRTRGCASLHLSRGSLLEPDDVSVVGGRGDRSSWEGLRFSNWRSRADIHPLPN